ncbi:TRAP transporter large permease [Marinobacterium aestuariivivens]|uniref:TRAP transporter large permease protein n=1 Tax=Marinobacterium aestuariivivens TaxID=1698799 RepID=A0ABW2A5I6_9GAMM
MGIETASYLMMGSILALLVTGLPLAFITGLIALVFALAWFGPMSIPLVTTRVYSFINEYVLIAIPMFVLMASILDRSGIAKDLYNTMRVFAGQLRGGVAVQTLVVAIFLAAMSGIIGGEIVLLGLLALPQMLRLGYDRRLSIGTVCAGGSLGTMVPPSIVLIIYGLTANVSISELFIATIFPAMLLGSLYIAYILIRCYLNPNMGPAAAREELEISWSDKLRMIKGVVLPVLVAIWVLGSIYAGVASVTEAACMGVVGVIVSTWLRKELNWTMIRDSLRQTLNTCGMIIWIGIGASALVGVYNLMGGNRFVESVILGLDVAPVVVVLIMMAILLILGLFMDWIGIALLTMPIFVPIVISLGYNPIWFGILFSMNMQVSYISPPFGPAAFYLKSVAPPSISLKEIFMSMWPFILLQLIALGLVLTFPGIALWLPGIEY